MLNISISVKLLDKYEFYSAICKNYPLYNMSYQTRDNTKFSFYLVPKSTSIVRYAPGNNLSMWMTYIYINISLHSY